MQLQIHFHRHKSISLILSDIAGALSLRIFVNWQCYVSVVRLCWVSSLRNSLELGIIILKYGNRVKVCTRQYMLNAIKYSEDSYDISYLLHFL